MRTRIRKLVSLAIWCFTSKEIPETKLASVKCPKSTQKHFLILKCKSSIRDELFWAPFTNFQEVSQESGGDPNLVPRARAVQKEHRL